MHPIVVMILVGYLLVRVLIRSVCSETFICDFRGRTLMVNDISSFVFDFGVTNRKNTRNRTLRTFVHNHDILRISAELITPAG